MAHDVFISHSSINKKAADAICHTLEQNGVKCWIAPRDIPPGANYGGEIIKGIKNCKVFLLVFSKEANASPAVAKEVERAVLGYKKTVIPFRIEDVAMSENLEFFLTDVHWLDAFPSDKVFDNLVAAVKNALGINSDNIASIKIAEPLSEIPPDKAPPQKPIPQTHTVTTTVRNAHNLTPVDKYPNVLQPIGTAVITRKDGTIYTVPANYTLVKTYDEIYEGVAKYYNGAFPIHGFSDLRSIENGEVEERHFNCELTKLDGTKETIVKETSTEFLAIANGNSLVTMPWSELKSIAFDWNKSCESGCDYVYVYCNDGEAYCLPAPFFFFGYRVRPDEDAMMWDSGIHWGDVFITDKNQTIYTNRLASIEFLAVEIDPETHKSYNRWLKRCQVSFTMKDGRSLKASLGMASLHFISVDGFGVFEIKAENINRIVFTEEGETQPQPEAVENQVSTPSSMISDENFLTQELAKLSDDGDGLVYLMNTPLYMQKKPYWKQFVFLKSGIVIDSGHYGPSPDNKSIKDGILEPKAASGEYTIKGRAIKFTLKAPNNETWEGRYTCRLQDDGNIEIDGEFGDKENNSCEHGTIYYCGTYEDRFFNPNSRFDTIKQEIDKGWVK